MPFSPIEWPIDSSVTLCTVPWDSSYRNVVRFDSEQAREEYFDSLEQAYPSIHLEQMTYLKPNEPVYINVPYSQAYIYNYLRVKNPTLPVPGEVEPPVLYYFITSVGYVAPNTTALELQLDVWQSYIYSCTFGRCFIERGHIASATLYNADNGDLATVDPAALQKYGTEPEGLDVGSEYVIANHEWYDLSNAEGDGWRVVVMSSVNLAADWGTLDEPNLNTADGQKIDGLIGGCNVYSLTADNFEELMDALSEAPWVSKGILSCSAFPSGFLTAGPEVELGGVSANFLGETPDLGITYRSGNMYQQTSNGFENRYHSLHKFMAYPYSYIELTNYQGSPLLLKKELCEYHENSMDGYTANVLPLMVASCAAPPYTRFAIYPYRYGVSNARDNVPDIDYTYATMDGTVDTTMITGQNIDCALWFQGFPSFSIVNDEYVNYLASTKNTRTWNYQSAGWTLAKSNEASRISYQQTQQSLDVAQQNKDLENLGTIVNGVTGAIGSLASGNILGAVTGAVGTGVGYYVSNQQFANTQNLTGSQAAQNYAYAQYAQQGDYQNTIAGIDAAVQDAALTQPSVSGTAGGDGFNLANGFMGVEIRYKTITTSAQEIIGEYWFRYGYACRRFLTPPQDLRVMSHMTYWKMLEVNLINARCDEASRDTIRGILEKGVTVWSRPSDIGTFDPGTDTPKDATIYY